MERSPAPAEEEKKDFNIESVSGLYGFLEEIESAYQADEEHSEEEAQTYKNLREKILQTVALIEAGEAVSDENFETIVSLYNAMFGGDEEGSVAEIIPAETPEPLTEVEVPPEVVDELSGFEPAAEAEPVLEPEPTPDVSEPEELAPSVDDNEEIETTRSSEDEGAEKLSELSEDALILKTKAEELLQLYKEAVNGYPDTSLNAAAHYYGEVETSEKRITAIYDELCDKVKKNTDTTELECNRYRVQLEEVEHNLSQLEFGLSRLFPEVSETDEDEPTPSKQSSGTLTVARDEHGASPIAITRPIPPPTPPAAPPRMIVDRIDSLKPHKEGVEKKGEVSELLASVMRDVRYRAFVEKGFSSVAEVERELESEIRLIDATDAFDKFLKIKNASAFHTFLKDKTMTEIQQFDRLPLEEKRQHLQEINIKYEVYNDWMNKLDQDIVVRPHATFGELFVRSELETWMRNYS